MIFVTDKGRLANNIFQYGQLYAWGREHGRKTMSMRFAHKYPDFQIAHTRHHHFLTYLTVKLAAHFQWIPVVEFNSLGDYTAQEQAMLSHRHVLATGWCVRYPDLFEKYRQEIIGLFAFRSQVRRKADAVIRSSAPGHLKLGIHIRRGDYRTWCGGHYFFDDEQYIQVIRQFLQLQQGHPVDIYLCTNDPQLNLGTFRQALSTSKVFLSKGSPAEDLCLLSKCDYLIGPPSSFTLVASMYHDAPLYWMADAVTPLTPDMFHRFDYQARHFDDYFIATT